MPDNQVKVHTECGIDVLGDKAVVLALYSSGEVHPDYLDPKTLPTDLDGLTGLNAPLPLDLAIKVYNKLGEAIEELIRRQGLEAHYALTDVHR